jgi:hypothetical protein
MKGIVHLSAHDNILQEFYKLYYVCCIVVAKGAHKCNMYESAKESCLEVF